MSEKRFKQIKWGFHDCPNGLYYLANSDGLYIGAGGYIWDDDKDGILAIADLLNTQQDTITALKEENEQLREDRKVANDFIVKKGLDVEYYKHWRGLQDE